MSLIDVHLQISTILPVFDTRGLAFIRGYSSANKQSDDQIVEEGKFRLYEARHVQGEETYKITREGDDLILTATLDLSPLDVEGPLAANLRVRRDLTPRQLTIKGRKASGNEVDLSVVIEGPVATVREGSQTRKNRSPRSLLHCSRATRR